MKALGSDTSNLGGDDASHHRAASGGAAMTYRRECDGMLALALALLVIAMVGLPVAAALAAQAIPRSSEACAQLAQTFRAHPIPWPMPRVILRASECS